MLILGYKKTRLIRSIFILSLFFALQSATGQCVWQNNTFKSGEVIEYEVYYNWGFIWLNAGWVRFKVEDATYKNKDVFLLDSYGASHENYDWIYKVRDHYKSYLDKESLKPAYFYRKNYEGGFEVENKYIFNWENNQIYSFTQNSDTPYKEDTLKVPDCTFDLLSLVYYARNINFNACKVGDKIPVISLIDNEIFNLYIRYLGKESIKDREGKTYSCIKFSALLVEGTIFKGGEDMVVWVTNDRNKIPVLVEAKILVGSVKAYLKNTKGLRYP